MRRFGLIGFPLSHSFSPGYFADKFMREGILDCEYKAYPISKIYELDGLITDDLVGLNVTIPYKEQVIPYMSSLSDAVQTLGAVNTIVHRDGALHGYNSDVFGFQQSLQTWIGERSLPAKALVLGSGGASKAVGYVCDQLQIEYQIVSRKDGYLNYADLSPAIMESHQLIVNTTPLGMSPRLDSSPAIPYALLTSDHFCYDLIYNPAKTLFLAQAEAQGASIKNGYDMLILQAEESWRIWGAPVGRSG